MKSLSYSVPLVVAFIGTMRCPDRDELEFTMLMFIVLAPLGYWIMWTLFALAGG